MTRGIHPAFLRRRLSLVTGLLRTRAPFSLTQAAAWDLVVDACQLRQRELGPVITAPVPQLTTAKEE